MVYEHLKRYVHKEKVIKVKDKGMDVAVHESTSPLWKITCHMGSQCYLPPGSSDFPAFTLDEAGTQFSNPGGMQG